MKSKLMTLSALLFLAGLLTVNAQTNYSLSFNGTSAHVSYSNSTSYSNTMTIEAWIKTTAYSSYDEIVGWGNTSSSTNHSVEFRVANGKLEFGINTNGWQSVASSASVNTGNWVHVAVVKNNTDIKLYINGTQDGSGTINQSPSVNVMEIGGFYYQQEMKYDYYFTGNIDEVRIWNTARTASEISNNMCKELTGSETGLTNYYKMNEGSGTTLNDNKTNGTVNGTIYNATYGYGPPAVTESSFDSNTYGSDSWIGYVYQSQNWPPNPAYQPYQYLGSITQTEIFNQNWGGSGPTLSGTTYIDNFHVRYRMKKSFPRGKYNITAGGDDGYRLSVDGGSTFVINDWSDHGYRTQTASNVVLGENTNLVLEFFEIGGGAQVSFDYTQVCLSAYIPTSPTASATGASTASISWAANGNDGSVSYNWAVKNQGGTTISNGTTSGTSASVTGLSANTTYYFTVVATNSCGSSATATSAEFTTFTTPTLAATSSMSVITATTATSGGNVTADGGASVTARGVCWSTTANPTITDSKTTDGSGTGSFTSNLTGLSAGTVYFVRAYATNSVGTAYGSQVSFTYTTSDIQASDFTNPSTVDVVVANGSTFNCNGTDHSYNSITVKPGGHLSLADTKSLNPGSLVLESDATGTATFIDNNTGENPPAITATVKQYLTSGRNWYLSSPITTATTAALSSATSIMYYNEPTASWATPTSGSTLNPMRGYISVTTNSTGTVNFVGTLNSGPKSISLTRTAGQTKEGFNLVGNPYPSNVSWNDATKTNLENTIWYRTQNQSAAYVFDTYGALTGIGTNNNGNGAVSGSIPAMQSFWVRVSSGKTIGTLAFDNTMRLHGVAGNKLKAPSAINATQKIVRLQVTNGTNSDETILVFNPLASDSYDAYDSPKMSNGSAAIPEIFSKAGSETVAINGMKTFETEKSVALGFNTGQSNTFCIKATEISGFDSDYKIVLYDKELGSEYNLSEILPYQFSSGVVNTLNRFEVRFKAPGITTDINTDKAENVSYSRINNREVLIIYNGPYTGNEMVSIYNATGIKMEMKPVTGSATTITLPYPSGVYIIKFQTDKKINTHKITIN